jgi:nitroreductase
VTTSITDVMRMLSTRASCRSFTDAEVPAALLAEILGASTCAPTSFSLQPYAFVVVRDATHRESLAGVIGNQSHVSAAPVFVVVCADLPRAEELTGMPGELVPAEHEDALLNSIIDASLAGMCLSLAAESAGLGTVMVGGVRNRPHAIAALLGLPPGVFALFGVCVGWPRDTPPVRPRLSERLIVHEERYTPRSTLTDGTHLISDVRGPADVKQYAWWNDQVRHGGNKFRKHRQVPWRDTPAPPTRS